MLNLERKKKIQGVYFLLPSLIGVSIFYFIPFIMSFFYAFTKGVMQRKFVGLQNFVSLFSNKAYQLAVSNTLYIVGIALPLLILLAVLITLVLYDNIKKYKWVSSVFLLPLVIPSVSLVLFWTDLFGRNGIVNFLLGTKIDILYSPYARWAVIGLIIWKNVGYNIILLLTTLLHMPSEYEEMARLEGANSFQVARWIRLPYLREVLFFVLVMSLLNSFKIFREVYVLQGNYPNQSLYMLQHFMNNNFIGLNYEILTAAAFVLYVFIFTAIYVIGKWQSKYRE